MLIVHLAIPFNIYQTLSPHKDEYMTLKTNHLGGYSQHNFLSSLFKPALSISKQLFCFWVKPQVGSVTLLTSSILGLTEGIKIGIHV